MSITQLSDVELDQVNGGNRGNGRNNRPSFVFRGGNGGAGGNGLEYNA
jgi:hypothetical protein